MRGKSVRNGNQCVDRLAEVGIKWLRFIVKNVTFNIFRCKKCNVLHFFVVIFVKIGYTKDKGGGITMAIRCATKAIIIENGAILLNRCKGEDRDTYYDLPGGGQKQYENLEQTVIREVKEETGYEVSVERFVALAEEINVNEEYRKLYPEYTHRVLHIFVAKLNGKIRDIPTEIDFGMEESVWVPLEKLDHLKTRPGCLKEILHRLAEADAPMYLGTEYIDRY